MGIVKTTRAFEQWLSHHAALIDADVVHKHETMAEAPFLFMRATFYRWIARWPKVCPDEAKAPQVLSVGDLHADNFGTWRDAQGRMVWGINDFDEAFPLPYTQDLVRLATSALLAIRSEHLSLSEPRACRAILDGYRESLEAGGRPIVVDEEHRWLAPLLGREVRDPVKFWKKMRELPTAGTDPPNGAMKALRSVLPDPKLSVRIAHRVAGLGSLGKPWFVALADWQGGPIAREAKALTPSACAWAGNKRHPKVFYAAILESAVRSPDPLFLICSSWLARRLAPDCCRVELPAPLPRARDDERLLHAMGWETANVHLGTRRQTKAVIKDFKRRRRGDWLCRAAASMLEDTLKDWGRWHETVESRESEKG